MAPSEEEADGEGDTEASEEPTEEEEAAMRDREGGRQFGRVMMVLGIACGLAGIFVAEDQYMVAGGLGLVVVGAIAHRWPVEIVRIFTGMSDKL